VLKCPTTIRQSKLRVRVRYIILDEGRNIFNRCKGNLDKSGTEYTLVARTSGGVSA